MAVSFASSLILPPITCVVGWLIDRTLWNLIRFSCRRVLAPLRSSCTPIFGPVHLFGPLPWEASSWAIGLLIFHAKPIRSSYVFLDAFLRGHWCLLASPHCKPTTCSRGRFLIRFSLQFHYLWAYLSIGIILAPFGGMSEIISWYAYAFPTVRMGHQ